MQTFLPYKSFALSAEVLDDKRLGKQRVEVYQILRTLAGITDGWKNHPAIKMWEGYETVLILYGTAICDEWIDRGFKDTCRDKILDMNFHFDLYKVGKGVAYPDFLGNQLFHDSHKSNLLRKNFNYYKQFNWKVPTDLPYLWGKKA